MNHAELFTLTQNKRSIQHKNSMFPKTNEYFLVTMTVPGNAWSLLFFFVWASAMACNVLRALQSRRNHPKEYFWCHSCVQPTIFFININYLVVFALSVCNDSVSKTPLLHQMCMLYLLGVLVTLTMTVMLSNEDVKYFGNNLICCIVWLQPASSILTCYILKKRTEETWNEDVVSAVAVLFWSVTFALIVTLSGENTGIKSINCSNGMYNVLYRPHYCHGITTF